MKLNEHINILNEENEVKNVFSRIKKTLNDNFLKIVMVATLIFGFGQTALNKINTDVSPETMRNTVSECQRRLDDKVDTYMKRTIPLWTSGYSLTAEEMDELGKIVEDKARERYRFLEKTVTDENLSNKQKINAVLNYFSSMEKEIDNEFSKAIKEFKKRPR